MAQHGPPRFADQGTLVNQGAQSPIAGHRSLLLSRAVSQSDFYRGLETAQQALTAAGAASPGARAAAVHTAMAPLFVATALAPRHACRIGCDHCCHLPVGITFGEAVRLAEAVRDLPALARHVVEHAAATAPCSWRELAGRPCPLLRDRACSVHASRPLPCRALASSDAAACARGLSGTADVPVDDTAFVLGLGAGTALATADAPPGHRELRGALAAVLTAALAGRAAAFAAARRVPEA